MNISFMNKLNDAQKKAAMHIDGPTYIDAGPGTGKSTTLEAHNLYIMYKHPTVASYMYVLTFTKSATRHFKQIMMKSLNLKEHSKDNLVLPHIYTIDELGKNLIKSLAKQTKLINSRSQQIILPYHIDDCIKGLTLIDDNVAKHIVRYACYNVTGRRPKARTIGSLYAFIQRCKRKIISYQDVKDIKIIRKTIDDKYHNWKLYYQVYKHYENEKESESLIDYSDMVYLPVILMIRYPVLKEYCQDHVKYLSIDEFQDTNYAQLMLAEQLIGKTHNICVVGDADQSLYTWRGASLQVAKSFQQTYMKDKNYAHIHLTTDYRSTKNIVNGSNGLIKKNSDHDKSKYIKAPSTAHLGSLIHVYGSDTASEEATYIINQIQNLKRNYKYKDIRILYRDNKYPLMLDGIVSHLRRAHIPYQLLKSDDFFNKKIIRYALEYLSAVVHWQKSIYVARVLNVPKRGLNIRIASRLLNFAHSRKTSLLNILINIEQYASKLRLSDKRQHALHFLGLSIMQTRQYMRVHSLYEGVDKAIMSSDIPNYIHYRLQKNHKRALKYRMKRQLSWLKQLPYKCNFIMKHYPGLKLKSPIIQLSTFLSIVQQSTVSKLDTSKDTIILSTIHSAKGSESPVVFMVGTQSGEFPSNTSMSSKHSLENERKVFYVGMTRAQDILYITHTMSGCVYSRHPTFWSSDSKFIGDIPTQYTDINKDTTPRDVNIYNNVSYYHANHISFGKRLAIKHRQHKRQKQSIKQHQHRVAELFKRESML